MPDASMSEALAEAYACAPRGVVIYHTLEIWHPSFSAPIRIVRDDVDLTAYLESDAAHNPGEEVTFVRYAFDFQKPEVSSTGIPTMAITIDNVSRLIAASIESALGTTDVVTVTYREYLSSDLTGPQNDPPTTLSITDITVDAFRITATCGYPDLMNRKFPTLEYNADDFPGLVTS